jgi:integrase
MYLGDQRMDRVSVMKKDEHEFSIESLDLSEYIDYLKGTGASKGTIRKYRRTIERLTDLMGRVPELWDADDLTRLMKEFSKPAPTRPSGYSRSTRIIIKAALKRYWESTGRTDLIGPGPFWQNGRGRSRYEYIKAHTASPGEVEAILEECRRVILEPKSSPNDVIRHFALFLVAGYGVRCKAIRYMRARDFNLQERTLHIYRTKGDKSRTIYMDIQIDDIWSLVMINRQRLIDKIMMTHSDKPELKERFEQLPWFFFTRMEKEDGRCGVLPNDYYSDRGSKYIHIVWAQETVTPDRFVPFYGKYDNDDLNEILNHGILPATSNFYFNASGLNVLGTLDCDNRVVLGIQGEMNIGQNPEWRDSSDFQGVHNLRLDNNGEILVHEALASHDGQVISYGNYAKEANIAVDIYNPDTTYTVWISDKDGNDAIYITYSAMS